MFLAPLVSDHLPVPLSEKVPCTLADSDIRLLELLALSTVAVPNFLSMAIPAPFVEFPSTGISKVP